MTDIRAAFQPTRAAAVAIHAALVEATRREWERHHGRVPNGMALFRLVTEDPEFAWLAPLTSTIAELDAALADPSPEAPARARLLVHALDGLLRADAAGGPFQARYDREVQASPELAVVVARARQALRGPVLTWT
ncbi:MAG TPA: hypothetical protein PLI93_02350 [Gemmatimonadales bacterium]|nr:hypothetical protein [Gemmatimonadota bacterium]HPF60876.1 hypothetical protein [Gemmatimonadales bacterium]HRX18815.1 hypothetical protein [Gemmatimonadales bacterium]